MIKIYTNFQEIEKEKWTALVKESAVSTFFQTRECYQFYDSLSFLQPFVFAVEEGNAITGLVCGYTIADGNPIKQFFSRRAIVPGGALLSADITDTALNQLLATVKKELKKKAIYIELRNYNDYSSYRSKIENSGFAYQAHLNFHVATPDVETALKKLSTTKRRDVKLSRKEGAEWTETQSLQDLKEYYAILEHLYVTRIKTPLFPIEFFENLMTMPQGKLLVVKQNDKVIGGSVMVLLEGVAVYEWFVCGLDGQQKNVFPSTLATWGAMEYAAQNGYPRFDMMGAGKPDEGYGVREFKSKFGGELVEHGRFLAVLQPGLYALGKYVVQKLKTKK
ncbi:MAG: hypothetical protein RIS29_930 [Bacteroidota bacterium]